MRDTLLADFLAGVDPVEVFEQAMGLEALDWQVPYLRETERNAILLKSRQIGASTAAAAKAIHIARYEPDSLVAIVSPSLKQSSEITAKARLGLRNLDERLSADTTSMLKLRNGSRILSLPGTARSIRGWSVRLLILDEAAFLLEETIAVARALVATGGQLVMQSTPAEEAGPFYEAWSDPDPTWARWSIRADEVPTISREFLDQERRALGPQFAAEYECEFGRLGSSLFNADRLAGLVTGERPFFEETA